MLCKPNQNDVYRGSRWWNKSTQCTFVQSVSKQNRKKDESESESTANGAVKSL